MYLMMDATGTVLCSSTQLISIDERLVGLKTSPELIQYVPNQHHHKRDAQL